jgi:threonine aldolase
LAQDHENALYLAKALSELEELEVDLDGTQTNMIFGRWRQVDSRKVADVLKRKGVLIFPSPLQRWVTHLDIHAEDLKIIVGTFKEAIHEARN